MNINLSQKLKERLNTFEEIDKLANKSKMIIIIKIILYII